MAREVGGRLLLRIEDIDASRCRPEYEAAIYEDLGWLGVSWQHGVRRQSEHFDDYQAALAKLEAQGLDLSEFREPQRDRARSSPSATGRAAGRAIPTACRFIPGRARKLPPAERERRRRAGEPFALRLAMDAAVARAGVLDLDRDRHRPAGPDRSRHRGAANVGRRRARAQGGADELSPRGRRRRRLQGVTDVVRGQDLFWSTSIHRLLQALLGLPEPIYHHHRLILDADGRKLSKSTQATSLRELRAAGATAADIRRMVGLGR